jgi:hypothetical protein
MSAAGRKAALAHGAKLPGFDSPNEAAAALTAEKDAAVASLLSDCESSPDVALDFSPDSLLRLERWYFERISQRRIFGMVRAAEPQVLAKWCALYFGEVVVRNLPGAAWVVEEFPFVPGRYTIGVRHGMCTMTLTSFHEKLHHPKNKKRDSVWRTYQHYFARNPDVTITF